MESKKRSLIKSLTWRMIGIINLGLITWVFTKNLETTTIITVLFHSINLILYFFHERLWERIEWGFMNKNGLSKQDEKRMLERLKKLGYIE